MGNGVRVESSGGYYGGHIMTAATYKVKWNPFSARSRWSLKTDVGSVSTHMAVADEVS